MVLRSFFDFEVFLKELTMRVSSSLALLATITAPTLGSVISVAQSAWDIAQNTLESSDLSNFLEIHPDYFDPNVRSKRKLCILHPRGDGKHDDSNFKSAVKECGKGGIVRLPDAN